LKNGTAATLLEHLRHSPLSNKLKIIQNRLLIAKKHNQKANSKKNKNCDAQQPKKIKEDEEERRRSGNDKNERSANSKKGGSAVFAR
jgi:DNA helicase IV